MLTLGWDDNVLVLVEKSMSAVSPASAEKADSVQGSLRPITIFVFALATGTFAGNLYLAQPLIEMIGQDLGMSTASLGVIVMLTQVGYALGMFFAGPLADIAENKRLILISVACVVIGMLGIGFAVTPWMFLIASFFVGLTAIGTQIIVPLAANLASDEKRGTQIGTIMAGLLTGIMLARPASSFLASLLGWRGPFIIFAVLMTGIGILLAVYTPRYTPKTKTSYFNLISTMLALPVQSDALRRRCVYQAIAFGVFNMFWTTSSLVLTDSFGLNYQQIALFALAGAGGALAAPPAGRLADRGLTRISTGFVLIVLLLCLVMTIPLVSWKYLILFAVSAVIIDAAAQANQVLGQATIYASLPEARARANAMYMTCLFIGAGTGSLIAPICFDFGGWPAVAGVAALFVLIAVAYWSTEYFGSGNAERKPVK